MSTNELEHQPTVAVENDNMADSAEDAIPSEKSGVRIDPDALMLASSSKFSEGDTVRMSVTVGETRIKGTYQVAKVKYSRKDGYNVYQLLVDGTTTLHNKGAWFRERDLRMDK